MVARLIGALMMKRGDSAMSLTDHIEDLRWHVVRSLLAILIGAIVAYINIEWIFHHIILGPAHTDFVSYRAMCFLGDRLNISSLCMQELNIQFQNTQLSGQFMMSFTVAFVMGFVIAFPFVFRELWKFIKPALKEKERKSARGIVFWTSLLFFTGVLFAYYIIAPFTINFFANYQLSPTFKNIITMENYYGTVNQLVLGIGLVFELPVVVYFLSKAGILTPGLMRSKRRYAILIIVVLSAVITPPDFMSLWMVALPLFMLYEISINISTRVAKKKAKAA